MTRSWWAVMALMCLGCGGDDEGGSSPLVSIRTNARSYPASTTARLTVQNLSQRQLAVFFGACTYLERKNEGTWQADGGSPPPDPCVSGSPFFLGAGESASQNFNVGSISGEKRFVTSIQIRDSVVAGGGSPNISRSESRSNEFLVN